MSIRTLLSGSTRVIACIVAAVDELAKAAVRLTLAPCAHPPLSACQRISLGHFLGVMRADNAGSALGFFQGLGLWTVMGAAAVALVWCFPRWGRGSRVLAVATGLLAGGAVGNLLDRVVYGRVTDFIDVRVGQGTSGFVLNPADVALAVGAILATVALYRALFRTPGLDPARWTPEH
jgi:lipoprotein signal peptidase